MTRVMAFGQGRFLRWALALFSAGVLAAAGVAAQTAPISAARFELSIDGHSIAVFSELAGISSAVPSGSTGKVTQVILSRAMTRNIEMAAWHELVILGDVAAARKSCSLTMYNAKGDPVARYHLTDAWPQKVEISTLKAGGTEVLMETVTMTAEFIQRISI